MPALARAGMVAIFYLPLVRDAGEVVAIHLEPYPDRSPATVAADLAYIATLGIRDV
jgi:hypothetical protein